MSTDRPALGILLMLAFCVLAPFADALSKLLGATLPVMMIVFARFVAQVVLLGPLALRSGITIRRRHIPAITYRAVLHIAGIALMFTSLLYLPLADAIAIAFVMPFIMLLLGWWVLAEEVGTVRLVACGVGFCGTLMVMQPSFVDVGWVVLMPLGVAVIFALFMLQTRQLAQDIGAVELQTASGTVATIILIPALTVGSLGGFWAFSLVPPTPTELSYLAVTGVVGAIAHLFMTWALRFAPSATLAPMQYLEIPFATLMGLLFFGDFPDGLALAGIGVTMAAGLFIIWREQRQARAPLSQPPDRPPAG